MSFRDALRQKDFVVAAELPLVPTSSRESIIADAGILAGTVDGLLFTDNQYGQPHMSPSFAAAVAKEAGFSPILQLGCRNRNRIALIGEILGAKGLDIDTLMFVRGNVVPEGFQPRPKAVLDIEVKELIATARLINDDEKLGTTADFLLGASVTVLDPAPHWEPEELIAKADAGAHFVITQLCFDIDILRRYVECLIAKKLLHRVSLIVSMAVLDSADLAIWLRDNRRHAIVPPHLIERMQDATDPVAEGRVLGSEFVREIANIAGVAGVNFTAGTELSMIPRILTDVSAERA